MEIDNTYKFHVLEKNAHQDSQIGGAFISAFAQSHIEARGSLREVRNIRLTSQIVMGSLYQSI